MGIYLDRRSVLCLGGVLALGACTTSTGSRSASSATGSGTSATTGIDKAAAGASSPPRTSGPVRPVWSPNVRDVEPQVKLVATRHVESTASSPSVEVVFAQYGGILADSASVIVVTHPWPAVADPAQGATYDVRLARSGGVWQVTQVHPSTPGAPVSTLSAASRQVLAHGAIELPPASRADIVSGQVHDSTLDALLVLARTYRVGVSVVRSGHPTYVFGTSRPSDHPLGRAFDTYRIDGQLVVDGATPRGLVTAYMQAAAAAGSYNVGGPYALGGPTYFSDNTHHDHVHAGFRA